MKFSFSILFSIISASMGVVGCGNSNLNESSLQSSSNVESSTEAESTALVNPRQGQLVQRRQGQLNPQRQEALERRRALIEKVSELSELKSEFVNVNSQLCLGRTSSVSEQQTAQQSIQLGRMSEQDIRHLITSESFNLQQIQSSVCWSIDAQITQVFRSILARNPEVHESAYWLRAIRFGQATIADVAEYLEQSPERQGINFWERSRALQVQLSALAQRRNEILTSFGGKKSVLIAIFFEGAVFLEGSDEQEGITVASLE